LCGLPNRGSYITHMNQLEKLKADNLDAFMGHENLIVVFTKEGCGACISIKNHLVKLDKKYKIVLVDYIRHPKSTRFLPIPINFFPKIGLFNRGYFQKELKQIDIINQTIDII